MDMRNNEYNIKTSESFHAIVTWLEWFIGFSDAEDNLS